MNYQILKYYDTGVLNSLTTIEIAGELWFLTSEICLLLDINTMNDVFSMLNDDEKLLSVLQIDNHYETVSLVSESGFYSLLFRCNKEPARIFKKWIAKEVLPPIRKTGYYSIHKPEVSNYAVQYNHGRRLNDHTHFILLNTFYKLWYRLLNK